MMCEADLGEVAASGAELTALTLLSKTWLEQNGTIEVGAQQTIDGLHEGLPVSDDMIWVQYKASAEAVQAVDPQAAADLQLDGPLGLAYSLPRFAPTKGGGQEYKSLELAVTITKRPVSKPGDQNETIFIRYDDADEEVTSDRIGDRGLPVEIGAEELALMDESEAMLAALRLRELETETGGNLMTQRECKALIRIAKRLDEIKAYDDR